MESPKNNSHNSNASFAYETLQPIPIKPIRSGIVCMGLLHESKANNHLQRSNAVSYKGLFF